MNDTHNTQPPLPPSPPVLRGLVRAQFPARIATFIAAALGLYFVSRFFGWSIGLLVAAYLAGWVRLFYLRKER